MGTSKLLPAGDSNHHLKYPFLAFLMPEFVTVTSQEMCGVFMTEANWARQLLLLANKNSLKFVNKSARLIIVISTSTSFIYSGFHFWSFLHGWEADGESQHGSISRMFYHHYLPFIIIANLSVYWWYNRAQGFHWLSSCDLPLLRQHLHLQHPPLPALMIVRYDGPRAVS
jgi:hypothetical protein